MHICIICENVLRCIEKKKENEDAKEGEGLKDEKETKK